ncbi:MAG: hypothetical protein Q8910_00380 [Bacteroidota bacterium]|nr:hypothetical protein [Bacteroidota bacterium]
MAKITVAAGKAAMYDGSVLYSGGPYTVNDTYANNEKAQKDVTAGLITITEAFSQLSDPEGGNTYIPVAAAAPVNAVAAALTTELSGDNNDMVFTAKTKGAAGGNIQIKYTDPAKDTAACTVAVTGSGTTAAPYVIDVTLKYASSAITATAANVKTAIEANATANALVSVANAAANNGTGVVAEMDATGLGGGVDGTVSEEGLTVQYGGYIYFTTADNTIHDANWLKVQGATA